MLTFISGTSIFLLKVRDRILEVEPVMVISTEIETI